MLRITCLLITDELMGVIYARCCFIGVKAEVVDNQPVARIELAGGSSGRNQGAVKARTRATVGAMDEAEAKAVVQTGLDVVDQNRDSWTARMKMKTTIGLMDETEDEVVAQTGLDVRDHT
jgi:hypothetical protein